MLLIIISILLGLGLVGLVLIYNQLVSKRAMVKNGWSDIDVQLKRRTDLIPNLIETVKAYAAHEKNLFLEITEKRTAAMNAGDDKTARGVAESALSGPTKQLLAVAEAYPELKANQNFLELQAQLAETEDKIEMARRFYNGAVRELNTLVQSFPQNIIASLFGFKIYDYFEIKTSEAQNPNLDFAA